MIKKFETVVFPHKEFWRFYRIKKRIFPILECLEYFPRSGKLVDLGCGNGLFAGLAALANPELKIIGIDDDEGKIRQARTVFGHFSNVTFVKGNIADIEFPRSHHFSIIDVLYLIPYDYQLQIMKRIFQSMSSKGILVIKEMDTRPLGKYIFNWLQETVSVKLIGRTLGSRFYFQPRQRMSAMLTRAGFTDIQIHSLDRGYWYPHVIYKCLKG